MLGRIDHIGVATDDFEGALALYEKTLGMPLSHRETVESQGVEAALLDIGDGHVELLRPLCPDTPVGKYLAKKGPGLHHVAYAVDDIDGVLQRLKEQGVKLTPEKLKELRKALDKAEGWLDLETDDGNVSVDLAQVCFLRSATAPHSI